MLCRVLALVSLPSARLGEGFKPNLGFFCLPKMCQKTQEGSAARDGVYPSPCCSPPSAFRLSRSRSGVCTSKLQSINERLRWAAGPGAVPTGNQEPGTVFSSLRSSRCDPILRSGGNLPLGSCLCLRKTSDSLQPFFLFPSSSSANIRCQKYERERQTFWEHEVLRFPQKDLTLVLIVGQEHKNRNKDQRALRSKQAPSLRNLVLLPPV